MKKLFLIIFSGIVFLIVFLLIFIAKEIFTGPPSWEIDRFINACTQLEGKLFTFQNIKSLNGYCLFVDFVGDQGKGGHCEEKNVDYYLSHRGEFLKDYTSIPPMRIISYPDPDPKLFCDLLYIEKDASIHAQVVKLGKNDFYGMPPPKNATLYPIDTSQK